MDMVAMKPKIKPCPMWASTTWHAMDLAKADAYGYEMSYQHRASSSPRRPSGAGKGV